MRIERTNIGVKSMNKNEQNGLEWWKARGKRTKKPREKKK